MSMDTFEEIIIFCTGWYFNIKDMKVRILLLPFMGIWNIVVIFIAFPFLIFKVLKDFVNLG